MDLFYAEGQRLYLTDEGYAAFLAAAAKPPREARSFCGLLQYTGSCISEALLRTPERVDLSGRVVVFESLKKRCRGVSRAVPVLPEFVDALDLVHGMREAQKRGKELRRRLWPWIGMTAGRRATDVIRAAGIPDGAHACPKGLRQGEMIICPLNLLV
jgi:integrase/recombinase XerD